MRQFLRKIRVCTRLRALGGGGPGRRRASAVSTLEDEVEPFSDEADPEHRNAHPARRIVGRGDRTKRGSWGRPEGDPEPHVLSNQGSWFCSASAIAVTRAQRGPPGDSGLVRPGFDAGRKPRSPGDE